jgi:hypothetical protein
VRPGHVVRYMKLWRDLRREGVVEELQDGIRNIEYQGNRNILTREK